MRKLRSTQLAGKKSRSLLHQGLALAEEEGLLWPLPL